MSSSAGGTLGFRTLGGTGSSLSHSVTVDAFGNARGGYRTSYFDVPISNYHATWDSYTMAVPIPGQAVTVKLDRDLDVARGDLLVPMDARPRVTREIVADLCDIPGPAATATYCALSNM
jgi:hypothetical protein